MRRGPTFSLVYETPLLQHQPNLVLIRPCLSGTVKRLSALRTNNRKGQQHAQAIAASSQVDCSSIRMSPFFCHLYVIHNLFI